MDASPIDNANAEPPTVTNKEYHPILVCDLHREGAVLFTASAADSAAGLPCPRYDPSTARAMAQLLYILYYHARVHTPSRKV